MSISKRDLDRLKQRLPRGYTVKVAEEVAKRGGARPSVGHVSHVLTGKQFDLKVIEAAIAVAERHEAWLADLAARMRGGKAKSRVPMMTGTRAKAA